MSSIVMTCKGSPVIETDCWTDWGVGDTLNLAGEEYEIVETEERFLKVDRPVAVDLIVTMRRRD